ncbi:hypothetical protein [Sphingobium sp. YBL2]|uniref:hypothetical protein n=1 Tax=Sphingobium sp. (strain YBL2) TaxID=484429 RepID=UPI0005CB9CA0|nr:hypothetical protein [Sphingobium sp. YBL2]
MLSIIITILGFQNLLLWRFLGIFPNWLYAMGILLVGFMSWSMTRMQQLSHSHADMEASQTPTWRRMFLLALVALAIFILGGEGRFFYASPDWQVRDSVLRDLAVYPWPFAYRFDNHIELLRAPLGMYLLPAVAAKAFGLATADLALLIQNSLFLTLIFGLGSMLFTTSHARARALVIVIFFSGMDVIGQWLQWHANGHPFPDHIEQWGITQYSSHITQAFWVPMHALSGWLGAVLFLLWREKRISLGQMYAPVPLLMLMSPLAVMGILPFAAYAGVVTLWKRELRVNDVLRPAITTLLTLPAILYLGAGSGEVGLRIISLPPLPYMLFELLEVIPFVAGAALIGSPSTGERATLLLVAACLLLMPLVQLGEGTDFTMRTSIPALAILAVQISRAFDRAATDRTFRRPAIIMAGMLLLGSVTGMVEIARAAMNKPSPQVYCNMATSIYQVAYLRQSSSRATYFAALDDVPGVIRPQPSTILSHETARCWDRPWQARRF